MKLKLNTISAILTVLFYLIFFIFTTLIVTLFFGGIDSSPDKTALDGRIDSMYANIIVMFALLFISLFVFKDSRKDIFFERKRFSLSKLYYLFPLASFVVSLFALFQVDFSAYSLRLILLTLQATLVIGINEEIITRGILLVGLRNGGIKEWKAWVITLIVFSLMHLLNLVGGESITILIIVATGGTLWYVSRRVFNNLFVSIGLHAFYDFAFLLLPGLYKTQAGVSDHVLDIQLASFLILFVVSILFVVFGRGLLKSETVGWSQDEI